MDYSGRSPGPFSSFRKDDFEADWTKVAEGGFAQVYQVKLKHGRETFALKSFENSLSAGNFYRWDFSLEYEH